MTLLSFMQTEMEKNYSFLSEIFMSPPKEIEDLDKAIKMPHTKMENYLIDVDNIVGTYHSDYQNNDFKSVCIGLKRKFNFRYDINDEERLKYLWDKKDTKKEFDWDMIVYKDKGYIYSGGNHRTIAAKFLAKCGKIPNKIYIPTAYVMK